MTEEQALARLSRSISMVKSPGFLPATATARSDGSSVARLYILSSCDDGGGCITVCASDTAARIDIAQMGSSMPGLARRFGVDLGGRPLEVDRARLFLGRLREHGAWELPDCLPNCIDGFGCIHVVADGDLEHCIILDNPDAHINPAYIEIINEYSQLMGCGSVLKWEGDRAPRIDM